jgi:hypothetical protein
MDAMDYSILHAKDLSTVAEPDFDVPDITDDVGRVYWTIRSIGRATHEEAVRAAKPVLLAWVRDRRARKETPEEGRVSQITDRPNDIVGLDATGAPRDFFGSLLTIANDLRAKHENEDREPPSLDDFLAALQPGRRASKEEEDEDETFPDNRF